MRSSAGAYQLRGLSIGDTEVLAESQGIDRLHL